jgi:hypothetical protein
MAASSTSPPADIAQVRRTVQDEDGRRDPQRRLAPAYDIFAVYKQRVAERVAYARAPAEAGLRLHRHERWEYDREDAPWAANSKATGRRSGRSR